MDNIHEQLILDEKKSLLFLFENDSPSWTQLPGHRNTDPVNGKLNLEMKIIVTCNLGWLLLSIYYMDGSSAVIWEL